MTARTWSRDSWADTPRRRACRGSPDGTWPVQAPWPPGCPPTRSQPRARRDADQDVPVFLEGDQGSPGRSTRHEGSRSVDAIDDPRARRLAFVKAEFFTQEAVTRSLLRHYRPQRLFDLHIGVGDLAAVCLPVDREISAGEPGRRDVVGHVRQPMRQREIVSHPEQTPRSNPLTAGLGTVRQRPVCGRRLRHRPRRCSRFGLQGRSAEQHRCPLSVDATSRVLDRPPALKLDILMTSTQARSEPALSRAGAP